MIKLRTTILAAIVSTATCTLAQTPAAASATGISQAATPSAPAPAEIFPAANPKYFTAAVPTPDTVNSFLTELWGYDPNRQWRVMAVQATAAPGVAKVTVFVADKTPNAKPQAATFYVTPDGKHAIAEGAGVIDFAAKPFADKRAVLQARADGAFRGAAAKDLEIVEFADLECPHCKDAQSTMDDIVRDFPKAHVVFQLFPLVDIHTSAAKAAAYGICVQQASNDAFFKFSAAVFDTQAGLTPATNDTILKAAVTAAGLDPAAIAACSATQATKDHVAADIKLAEDVGVDQTPLLSVNGRMLPIGQIPYETLKEIILFQAKLDGVETGAAADILTPKPAQPKLSTLPK